MSRPKPQWASWIFRNDRLAYHESFRGASLHPIVDRVGGGPLVGGSSHAARNPYPALGTSPSPKNGAVRLYVARPPRARLVATAGLFLSNPAATFTAPDLFGVRARFRFLRSASPLKSGDLFVASITARAGDWHDDEVDRCSVTFQFTNRGARMNNRSFDTGAPKDPYSTTPSYQAIMNGGVFVLELAISQTLRVARGRLLRFYPATQSVLTLWSREGSLSTTVPGSITAIGAVLAIDSGDLSASVEVTDFRLYA